jgi:Putative Ig domain
MTHDPLEDELFSRLELNRRELVRRLIAGTAFAVPIVASFDMAGLTTTSADAVTPNQVRAGVPNQPLLSPQITSGASATFLAGRHGSFAVSASGSPAPGITASGGLPPGVSLIDNGGGSATLSGTPQLGSGGVYEFKIIASGGWIGGGSFGPSSTSQEFRLTVREAPAITSPASASVTIGHATVLSVTTAGFPIPTVHASGKLPNGLTFTSGPRGSALISGTPRAGTQGVHRLAITAANGIAPNAVQHFSLTVHRSRKRNAS